MTTINGGVAWTWATNNDGMDCNGSAGFELNGGIIGRLLVGGTNAGGSSKSINPKTK